MAVTGAIFNKLIFGEIDSSDYGIYITGEAVFNAPKRAVTMVDVPGRNGALAIDQGHWENIEVTYPAGLFGSDKDDFRAAISEFRNALASQIGYQRLEDSYHPDEYRMGLFFDGIEVDPVHYNTAGEFTIKFNCKPQRWLTSGEEAVTVSSGDTLTNPTQYESSPLLAVTGSGTISFNGFDVQLLDQDMGYLRVADTKSITSTARIVRTRVDIDSNLFNSGDAITIGSSTLGIFYNLSSVRAASFSRDSLGDFENISMSHGSKPMGITVSIPTMSISLAEEGSTITKTGSCTVTVYMLDGSSNKTFNLTLTLTATGNSQVEMSATLSNYSDLNMTALKMTMNDISGYSTKPAIGLQTYVDCELGEAFRYDGDTLIPLNNLIAFGSDLPTLGTGANEITHDDTITALSITPRWWKL